MAPALNLSSYSAFQRNFTSAPVHSLPTSLFPLHGPGMDKQALGPVLSPTTAATEAPREGELRSQPQPSRAVGPGIQTGFLLASGTATSEV